MLFTPDLQGHSSGSGFSIETGASPPEFWQEVVVDELAVIGFELLDRREILGLGVEIRLLQGLQEGQQSPVLLTGQVRVASELSSGRVPRVEGVEADHIDGLSRQSLAGHRLPGLPELLDIARMALEHKGQILVMSEGEQALVEAAVRAIHATLAFKSRTFRVGILRVEVLLREDVGRVEVATKHEGVPHTRPLGHGPEAVLHADLA
mmetsp:Transcript_5834/g.13035  ORF Transcript_5834/g.13035 Transcript_5834/m.13035 type:complete len:207 (-) Transcript_5834:257-877(-)